MTESETFDVVVTGFSPQGDAPALRLQRVFGLSPDAAERLLSRVPAPVKRNVPRVRAEYFRRALLKIGAHVEVVGTTGEAVPPLASVAPPAPHESSAPPVPAGFVPDLLSEAAALPVARGAQTVAAADAPLAPSLRPEALATNPTNDAPLSLAFDVPPAPFSLDDVPLSAVESGAAPGFGVTVVASGDADRARQGVAGAMGVGGATADTLYDARPVVNATLLEGRAAPAAPASSMPAASGRNPASRAAATMVVGAAVETPAEVAGAARFASSQALAGDRAAARSLPSGPTALVMPQPVVPQPVMPQAGAGFAPPALSLGFDDDVMSRLPSSVWDAPPGAVQVAANSAAAYAPLAQGVQARAGGAAAVGAQASSQASSQMGAGTARRPAAKPRASRKSRPGREVERPAQEPAFWTALPAALALPFSGRGPAWIALLCGWALLAGALTALARPWPVLAVVVAFAATAGLFAIACDYARACFWVETRARRVERGPSLSVARVVHAYLKLGMHVLVFALVVGLPLVLLAIAQLGEGATLLELMLEAGTWIAAAPAALVWPGAVALTAHKNDLAAAWNVPQALSVLRKATGAYLVTVLASALVSGASAVVMLALAGALGLTGVSHLAVMGLPLALGHGVIGALLGQLARSEPEVFR